MKAHSSLLATRLRWASRTARLSDARLFISLRNPTEGCNASTYTSRCSSSCGQVSAQRPRTTCKQTDTRAHAPPPPPPTHPPRAPERGGGCESPQQLLTSSNCSCSSPFPRAISAMISAVSSVDGAILLFSVATTSPSCNAQALGVGAERRTGGSADWKHLGRDRADISQGALQRTRAAGPGEVLVQLLKHLVRTQHLVVRTAPPKVGRRRRT